MAAIVARRAARSRVCGSRRSVGPTSSCSEVSTECQTFWYKTRRVFAMTSCIQICLVCRYIFIKPTTTWTLLRTNRNQNPPCTQYAPLGGFHSRAISSLHRYTKPHLACAFSRPGNGHNQRQSSGNWALGTVGLRTIIVTSASRINKQFFWIPNPGKQLFSLMLEEDQWRYSSCCIAFWSWRLRILRRGSA